MTTKLDELLSGLTKAFQELGAANPHLSHKNILEIMKPALDESPCKIIVSDVVAFRPAYLNKACRDFTGVKEQQLDKLDNRFYYKYVHNDSIQIVPQGVSHFSNQAHLPYHVCYKINMPDKSIRWIYLVTYSLSFLREDPKHLEYMISSFMDVGELIDCQPKTSLIDHQDKMKLLKQLSSRELQILKLFNKEMDAEDIASTMNISTNTVKTYRQKIMQKLGVRSGIGLGRFGMLTEWM